VGTGYPVHISHSPSVKVTSHRISQLLIVREHIVRRCRRTQVPLVLPTQLR
jgi:hypothetical protein